MAHVHSARKLRVNGQKLRKPAHWTQVIAWMKKPVPYKDYITNAGCKAPTDMWFPSGSFCKKVQCVHGE